MEIHRHPRSLDNSLKVLSGRELFGLTPRITFGEVLSSANYQNFLSEVEQSARRTLNQHLSHFK
jgi:hypothetical protein